MFRRNNLYERMLREKDRQIDILAEQIDWLRMQLAHAGRALDARPLTLTDPGKTDRVAVQPYVSDEELDAQALLDAGTITESQVPEVLEALGVPPELLEFT